MSWLAGIIGEEGLPRFAPARYATREEALSAVESIATEEIPRLVAHDIDGHVTVFHAERRGDGEWELTPYPKL